MQYWSHTMLHLSTLGKLANLICPKDDNGTDKNYYPDYKFFITKDV